MVPTFTDEEVMFLGHEGLGRIATLSADGAPALAAVRYRIEEVRGETVVVIPGYGMRHSAKFHNVRRDGRVAFLVDNGATGGGPHDVQFLQIRGTAESVEDEQGPRIVLHPTRIVSMNINPRPDEGLEFDSRDVGSERQFRLLVD